MKRVLLKLSGEALAGDKHTGFDEPTVTEVAKQVKQIVDGGTEVGIVIGAIFWIGAIGSRNDTATFFRCRDGSIKVVCGCFFGNLDEFAKKVRKTHGDNDHAKVYMLAIEMAKIRIGDKKEKTEE